MDNAIDFPNTYPLNSDLSDGKRYRMFEQPEPDALPLSHRRLVVHVNILRTARFGMQKGAWHMCSVTNVMAHCRLTLYNFTDVTAVVRVRQRDVHLAHPPRHIFVMQ